MKILFTVEFYDPHKGGAEEVVKQLAERLAKKGHEVTVATSFLSERTSKNINGVIVESFKISGNAAQGYSGAPEEIKRYRDLLESGFNVVLNYAAQIWTTDLAFEVLHNIKEKKFLVPCGYSGLRDPAFASYFEGLPAFLKKYDKLIYMSPNYQDKIFGDEHGVGDKAVVIPNGAAAEEFLPPDNFNVKKRLGIASKYVLITVANHYRDKGHNFVIDSFLKMNRPDATLLVIGENPGADLMKKVKQFIGGCFKTCLLSAIVHKKIRLVRGIDRQLVLSAYKQADLFLFGSKVECAPLVLYESFAGKTAFISTSVGNVPDYKEVVSLVKTPEEMAKQANFILDNPQAGKTATDKAFNLWKENFTWDKIVDQYEKLLI